MKKIAYWFLFITSSMVAQEIERIPDSNIDFIPIQHATFLIKTDTLVIYVDPYGGKQKFEDFPAPDLILITDIHGDHFNINTLQSINCTNATFVVPEAVALKLPENFKKNSKIIRNGEKLSFETLVIEAIPMYNLPEDEMSRHIKGRGNGYILTINDKRIYISGDTEDIPEMRGLQNIHVAFICMNLPYTMDIFQAADAVLEFKPRVVYPYHYRGKPEISNVNAFKELVTEKNSEIDVRLLDWYPKS
jgi:L-ascorbate metabolism protein UlaG (beta-lactamase superfamily)